MSEEKPDTISAIGTVTKALPNAVFEVLLDNGHSVTCHISGKIRLNNIKILVGDKVDVDMSIYSMLLGRIVFRYKK
jgi:translation initiation factor IF-1